MLAARRGLSAGDPTGECHRWWHVILMQFGFVQTILFFFSWALLGSQDNTFVPAIYLAVKANGEMAKWFVALSVFCLEDGWWCLFWAGSIANQVFHQVMFDKCLHTLTKCWPRQPDLMRKRKKMHPQSSETNARRSRKKGKPCRNGNVRCLCNLFRCKSLLITKLLASYFTSRSVWYSFSFSPIFQFLTFYSAVQLCSWASTYY